jgi:TRAP-type uncharacterized transport system fused permease subunit
MCLAHLAGAAQATTSTGGQITSPILEDAAFIIATHLKYR